MADFGIYFQVVNTLPVPLHFSRFKSAEGGACTYNGPQSIPNDGKPHRVHLNDPRASVGAEGTAYFIADIDGVVREYAWYGDCPVWSPKNRAHGPGVSDYNRGGHPLTVTIAVDESTNGWKPAERLVHHVFVLMLENRSFDHMLGYWDGSGNDAVTGAPTHINGLSGSESNSVDGTPYPVTKGADWRMPLDPLHEFCDVLAQVAGPAAKYDRSGPYPSINMSGFAADYSKAGGQAPGEIMKCYDPTQLPVLTTLAAEFAVCDAWYSSMPGPTWPNRFFMMAASAGGLDRSPDSTQIVAWEAGIPAGFSFQHGSLFDAVRKSGGYRIYRGDRGPLVGSIPISGALKGVSHITDVYPFSRFPSDVKGDYPYAFTLIEPNYGNAADNTYLGGNSQHPMDDVRSGEALIKITYEAIRNSPLWQSSLLIVTWDEHGGFYDHVAPGPAAKPGDIITTPGPVNLYGFDFDTLGVRVPAVVISPFIERNVIDHRLYDHSSIPATVETLFRLSPLTHRDAAAADVTPLLTLTSPRPTPTSLPAAEVATTVSAASTAPSDDGELIGASNLAGFLHVAMRIHLEMAPAGQRQEIVDHVAALQTRAEARAYIRDVVAKLNAADGVVENASEPVV